MRIDGFNKIGQILNSGKVSKVKKTDAISYGDKLELSRTGNDYTLAKQVISQIPDVRTDKINEIKKRMEAGTYNVSMEEVAEKIVNRYFDELI
ncbi:FlgM family anti-sigma-28 factor [Herbinix hemicellulosilytica]|uniref:Negative regulator of flagellin synthesis n=1 Tax=Herbinix hemicellulosilytica TaxID=1564487 RepID=A0A0H5SI84_HERHM|nr:flagellar biosynthesis anti-sigma factor FlgM [Herbinix hemicellulosilytica]RBP59824.1 FlgM family anti-sigma-28 factor [Herbinix hemicellulosilytica]CRZ35212.1 hypothetical protein HHT355_2014 [Herbinix hemicellulosilytica]